MNYQDNTDKGQKRRLRIKRRLSESATRMKDESDRAVAKAMRKIRTDDVTDEEILSEIGI